MTVHFNPDSLTREVLSGSWSWIPLVGSWFEIQSTTALLNSIEKTTSTEKKIKILRQIIGNTFLGAFNDISVGAIVVVLARLGLNKCSWTSAVLYVTVATSVLKLLVLRPYLLWQASNEIKALRSGIV